MGISYDFTKEPKELVEYLKQKGLKLTFNYEEMMHEAHHKAFTVAKVTKLDLLSDIHTSLQVALKEGKLFPQWKDELKPTLKEKGWWGEVEAIDPRTGEVKNIFVGSRRLKNIYDTNMRTAYAKARYESHIDSDAEYLRYVSLLEGNRRISHRAKHGIILPKTDPWWNINYPPNAWGCKCKAQAVTSVEMKARGLEVSQRPPNIADKDWAYNPGKTNYFDTNYTLPCLSGGENAKKVCLNKTNFKDAKLPDLRDIPQEYILKAPEILKAAHTQEERFSTAKKAILGNKKSIEIQSPQEKIIINEELINHFTEKENREIYANFIIPTLENPLEIWYTRFDDGKIRPQYIALFDTPKAMLVSVILNRDGSFSFWNAMQSDVSKMNKKRVGEWFWKRY